MLQFLEILNLEGHQNRITGSRVTAILPNGWTSPIGEAASGRVCACSLRNRLVSLFRYKSNEKRRMVPDLFEMDQLMYLSQI